MLHKLTLLYRGVLCYINSPCCTEVCCVVHRRTGECRQTGCQGQEGVQPRLVLQVGSDLTPCSHLCSSRAAQAVGTPGTSAVQPTHTET